MPTMLFSYTVSETEIANYSWKVGYN